MKAKSSIIIVLGAIILIGLGYSAYYGYTQTQKLASELDLTQQQFASSTAEFQAKVADLEGQLASSQNEND